MTPQRWERIKDLFESAVGLADPDRCSFLAEACRDDETLRSEVERLLASDACASDFLEHPAALADPAEIAEPKGKRIGRYSIEALIGSGGMGAVYRAIREDDFRMQVAIKLLKRGTDTDAALARFRTERQILAGLQHPNIGQLFDGGATEDGLPYFVMEYVDGAPLLDYTVTVPLRKRIELFRDVCSAVQYAHDKNVVHRDTSPPIFS